MSYGLIYAGILLFFTVLVWLISSKSGLLRNEIFSIANLRQIANAKGIKNPSASFSLGRTQLAFWTVIIVSSFVKVVIQNSAIAHAITVPLLNGVNLALLGIASGTTVIAKVIDSNQMDSQGDIIPQQDRPSKEFFTDLISDEKGVSVHRLQNLIWTMVVGAIYIWYVATNDNLPDDKIITSQLLALMGVSTGAYLGLKTVENKAIPASDVYKNNAVDGGGSPAAATPAAITVIPVTVTPAAVTPAPVATSAATPVAAATDGSNS